VVVPEDVCWSVKEVPVTILRREKGTSLFKGKVERGKEKMN
jgi:hypothetical protein